MSYANMVMYNAVVPSFESSDTEGRTGGKNNEVINADDPKNKEKVRKILYG